MDNQEFFDKTVEHLRNQGCKAEDKYGMYCRYSAGNRKCAIGAHIPDEIYHERFEKIRIANLLQEEPSLAKIFNGVGIDLMRQMQLIHDTFLVKEWESQFDYVAEKFGLTYTPPKSVL